jgi:hypothetical protein
MARTRQQEIKRRRKRREERLKVLKKEGKIAKKSA